MCNTSPVMGRKCFFGKATRKLTLGKLTGAVLTILIKERTLKTHFRELRIKVTTELTLVLQFESF